jgi:hypothetical protein
MLCRAKSSSAPVSTIETSGSITAAKAELEPAAAEGVDDGGVLGHPQRVLEGQDDDGRAELDAPRTLRGGGQKRQGRRQSAGAIEKVMLGDPAGVEPERFGGLEQLQRDAVRVGRIGADVEVGQEAESRAAWRRCRCLGSDRRLADRRVGNAHHGLSPLMRRPTTALARAGCGRCCR